MARGSIPTNLQKAIQVELKKMDGVSIGVSCASLGISRPTFYNYRRRAREIIARGSVAQVAASGEMSAAAEQLRNAAYFILEKSDDVEIRCKAIEMLRIVDELKP